MAHADGTPVWFELNTPDPDTAQRFYTAVTDWNFATSPVPAHGGYRMAGPGQAGVAGVMQAMASGGGFPGWAIYFASRDVDAAAARVRDLGGEVAFGPMDIPHVGRFVMVRDPQGVVFSLMTGIGATDSQAFRQVDPNSDGASLGHGVWIELATPDADGAFAFYGALFGWTKAGGMPMGELGEYAFIGAGGPPPGAIMPSTTTGAPARWNWYVHVADIDAAIATAKAEGGAVVQEPMQIPGGSYSANITDPQGFQLGLVGPRKS